jgi:hypothetical protein
MSLEYGEQQRQIQGKALNILALLGDVYTR